MADITKSECTKIVQNALKNENFDESWIKSFKVYRVSEGLVGFMGEYYKLNVELENIIEGKPNRRSLSYFIKSAPTSDENFHKEIVGNGFFDRETKLYANLLEDIQKYSPTKLYPECYYTRPDLLVLEDLSSQAWCHITPTEDISLQFFKVVLKKQAYLHAGSIAYELDTGVNIGEKFKDILHEFQFNIKNDWFTTGLKSIVCLAKMIPKYFGTQIEDFISRKLYEVLCSAGELTKHSDVYKNVLCHRDTWARNVFFKCDQDCVPIDCLLFDFQLTRYCPPALDVLFFIWTSTVKKQRELIIDQCLEYYYSTFVDIMNEKGLQEHVFLREEFFRSCKELDLVMLILKAICTPFTEMPEGMVHTMRTEDPDRYDYYMNTDREELLLRIIANVPGYKEMIIEPVEELMEWVIRKHKL